MINLKNKVTKLFPSIFFIVFILIQPCQLKGLEKNDESKHKLIISSGINYTMVGHWDDWGRIGPENGYGYNIGIKYLFNPFYGKVFAPYFGFGLDFHNTQTNITPSITGNEEINEYYQSHSEYSENTLITDDVPVVEYIIEYLGDPICNSNAKFNNTDLSIIFYFGGEFLTKIGKPFFELGLAIGKAWYNADNFIKPEVYQHFEEFELDNVVADTKKLHNVDSELLLAYKLCGGIWSNFKILNGEIGLIISYMKIEGQKYNKEVSRTSPGGIIDSFVLGFNSGYLAFNFSYRFSF